VSRSTLLYEKHLEEAIERNLDRLRFELSMGTARRHLDVLTELIRTLLAGLPATALRDTYQAKLDVAERMVACRHNLRIVKGRTAHDNEI
jgi:hypothetical protein